MSNGGRRLGQAETALIANSFECMHTALMHIEDRYIQSYLSTEE